MLFFWYCFDEWAVQAWHLPVWAGHIPWPVILLAHIPLLWIGTMFMRANR